TGSGLFEHVGTAPYMAPELTRGEPATPATDWYALGATLFDALTGAPPHVGTYAEIAESIRSGHVHSWPNGIHPTGIHPTGIHPTGIHPTGIHPTGIDATGINASLREFIDGLLADQITRSPSSTIRAQFGAATVPPNALLGRNAETQQFDDCLHAAIEGRQSTVLVVRGPSGRGKSHLATAWRRRLPARMTPLYARCHARESVPYPLLDALVDGLVGELATVPADRLARIQPRYAGAVTRFFEQLVPIAQRGGWPEAEIATLDADQERRRAFRSLSDLLSRVADESPVVVFIDDVHRIDADDASALSHLLAECDSAILFVLTARPGKAGHDAVLDRVRPHEIALPPLSDASTFALALSLTQDEALARVVADAAAGEPLLVTTLARRAGPGLTLGWDLVLPDVDALPSTLWAMLDLFVVAGEPIPAALVRTAGSCTDVDFEGQVSRLEVEGLISQGADGSLAVTHDRVMEARDTQLTGKQRRAAHLALAESAEQLGLMSPAFCARHYSDGGDHRAASRHAQTAGQAAHRAKAFGRAADLYELCLELWAAGSKQVGSRLEIATALADCRSLAGQPHAAAATYLEAAQMAADTPEKNFDLQLAGVEHLLMSGNFEEAAEPLARLLTGVGLPAPPTGPRQLLRGVLAQRIAIRWTRPQEDAPLSSDAVRRSEACFRFGQVLLPIEPLRAVWFLSHAIRAGFRSGDPTALCRALAMDTLIRVSLRNLSGADSQLARAHLLAARVGDTQLRALVRTVNAMTNLMAGDLVGAANNASAAIALLREAGLRVGRQLALPETIRIGVLAQQGGFAEAAARMTPLISAARSRGDRIQEAHFRLFARQHPALVNHDAEGLEADVAEALGVWPATIPRLHFYHALRLRVEGHLMVGDGASALAHLEEGMPTLREARFHRAGLTQQELRQLEMRAIAMAIRNGQAVPASRVRRLTRHSARQIRRRSANWALWVPAQASILAVTGKRRESEALLAKALTELETGPDRAGREVLRYRLATLRGSDEELALAFATLKAMGIVNPERWADRCSPSPA
ncbi:MAG: hypothetical protein ACI9OJ_002773, partial [Myxococcota bacterium]